MTNVTEHLCYSEMVQFEAWYYHRCDKAHSSLLVSLVELNETSQIDLEHIQDWRCMLVCYQNDPTL